MGTGDGDAGSATARRDLARACSEPRVCSEPRAGRGGADERASEHPRLRRALLGGLTATGAGLCAGLFGPARTTEADVAAGAVDVLEWRFDAWDGPALPIALARPRAAGPDAPLLFVFHGIARGAAGYRNAWIAEAARRGVIVAAPKFSKQDFPSARGYQQGDLGHPGRSSHAAIEPLFDWLRGRLALSAERYHLYGHSAGAQFVHRYLFRTPTARAAGAVAANAGWWLRPDPAIPYPYGLNGAPYDATSASGAMRIPLTVLLGLKDTRRDGSLRQTPGAEAQGPHRVARGAAFFVASERLARDRGARFAWRLRHVPGVGHSNAAMAPHAARALFS